ncbi:hypothetical protein ES705_01615 [subsurface metagenome]|nr:amidohydrolase family protein [Clostridia bacterium]
MIIDVHSHLGEWDVVFDEAISEKDLVDSYNNNNVDIGIVQPLIVNPTESEQKKIHNEVHVLTKKHYPRFYGMASLNPHTNPDFYYSEVSRCVKELGFKGLKISPIAHSVNPLSRDGRLAFEAAKNFNIPLMIHTGAGIPFALPSLILPMAKEYPDVFVVIAHSGSNICAAEAIIVAKECENVFLDTSWIAPHICKHFIKVLGSERLMFASDMYDNQIVEIAKWQSLKLSDNDYEWIFNKTARQVYNI